MVTWPLFQGLASREDYPFHTLHRVVRAFCEQEGIAHLDLLDAFLGQRAEDLWVDPSDMHGNEVAHSIATPVLAAAIAEQLR